MQRRRSPLLSSATLAAAATSPRSLRYLCLFAVLLIILAFSALPGTTETTEAIGGTKGAACERRRLPRAVSHRGVDEDEHGGAAVPSTLASISRMLDERIDSFDLDLFWPADDVGAAAQQQQQQHLYIGHPPSLRQRWRLEGELHATPLAELERVSKADGGLLRLEDLLRLLAERARRRPSDMGLVSFELKYPNHPEWRQRLQRLYAQIAASGLPHVHVAGVVLDASQAAAHRAAMAAAGIPATARPALLCVLKDIDAPLGRDGERHANLSAVAAGGRHFDGWSASVRLLDASLRSAATASSKPLAVWTVDDEASLRRAFLREPDDVVTNRVRWARRTLERWRAEECKK